jgi:uncharacterized alpha-E superfamily protein
MLSRVADSLYWMSRYLERAENTVRQLDVTMSLMLDTSDTSAEKRWQRMMASLGKPPGMVWNDDLESMARMLVFDSLNHAAVTFCINGARETPGPRRNFNRAVAKAQPALPPDALSPRADPVPVEHQ